MQTNEATQTRRGSSADRIAAQITEGVLDGEFPVGQRLVEADLTARFGVSRTTVREALRTLAAGGLVEIVPDRGAVVRGLSRDDADCLFAVLEVLIGLVARLAAERINRGMNRDQFKTASAPLIGAARAAESGDDLAARTRFYDALLDIAANPELRRVLPLQSALVLRQQVRGFLTRTDRQAMTMEYRAIGKAVLEGDGDLAERAAREHIALTRQRTVRLML